MKIFAGYTIKYMLLSASILTLPTILKAQSVISGKTVDTLQKPVANVTIRATSNSISSKDGSFTLKCPADSSSLWVHFSCIGYKSRLIKLYVGEENVEIMLQDTINYLNEVTIRSDKYSKFSNYAAQTTQMSTLDILTNPKALGNIIGGLSVLPGVQSNDNDGRLIIQGGDTDESQVIVDGLTLYNPYTLSQKNVSVRSRFSPDLFSGISLHSTGYGAEYGNALSGILELKSHSLKEMSNQTDINISSIGLASSFIRRTNRNAIRGEISYSNLNPYGKLVKDDYEWKKRYEQTSGDLFWIHLTPKGDEIKTHAYYSQSGVHYLYHHIDGVMYDNNFFERSLMVSSTGNYHLSEKWKLYAGSNFAYNRFTGTDVSAKSDQVKDIKVNSQGKVQAIYQQESFSNKAGIEDQFASFYEKYSLQESYKLKYSNHQLACFDEVSWLTNRFSLNIGLRGEYSSYLRKINLSPRLYASYKLNTNNIASFSWGKYVQLPNANYLKLTKMIHFKQSLASTLSYSYVRDNSKLQLDFYYKKYQDLITYNYTDLYPRDISNQGEGYAKGFNLFWKKNIGHLEYWLSYSYLNANIKSRNLTTSKMPEYLSSNTLNLTTKYWIKQIHSLLGASFFIDSGARFYNEYKTDLPSKKSPSRNRLDLSLSYLPMQGVILHFSCQNVLGRRNIYGYEYSSQQNEMSPITQPGKQFYYIGLFITLSNSHKNQLKAL